MNLCAQYLRQAEALKADMTDSKLGPADIWTSRQALQDLYQKMLVTDLEYALDKKVEQDLWNHAFKNQITTLQSQAKNRGNPNRSEVQANLSLFLEAASGFYTQLLQELCTVFNVDLPCRVKSSRLGIISNKQNNTSAIVKPQPSSCSYICQHCLVHLGDIARYRNQTSQAESYYRHAAQLVPSNGQPYNQLAILASSKGDHLTTIFYYCRSIAVKFPFPAASTNLQKALSKALESRDEVKTKWSVSDFIKAFIKFHGHVYLSRSLEKLSSLREKLEEQFQRLILQKAFSSQQLVHITVINLFELHHLRDYSSEADEQNFSPDEQISWIQLLALFMSFLGIMCSRALLSKNHEEVLGECPLPAIKVSLDWLKLRPRVFNESAVDKRQYVWSWLVAILNSFQPREDDVTCTPVMPLPEEFELQGFLALRPALRALDFSKGHQGIIGDKGLPTRARHQRLISLGKWVADNQPRLIQYRIEDGVLQFITDIPQMIIEEPQDKDGLVLQESSNSDPPSSEGSMGLKSVLSVGKSHGGGPEGGERPVVTFKENIKPREHSRELARNLHQKEGSKDRRDYSKGNGTPCKNEQKKDNKRKNESKKNSHEKTPDSGKQAKGQSEMTKVPVSESRKTPVTQTQTTSSSQFIPIHHPGAFPPLPSRPGFPPPAYVIPPPVAFSMNPGFTFSTGVSVPGPFLQPASHTQTGTQIPAGKQSHIPYSQQRPSGPGAINQGPQQQQQGQQPLQPSAQLQVQALSQQQQQQQQQSPTKPMAAQQGKSPPHHPGMQQYMQVSEQSGQLWNQHQPQPSLQKMPLPVKQPFFMSPQDPMKLFEHQVQAVPMQPPQSISTDKKVKYPEVKAQDFYWESPYRMADNQPMMSHQVTNERLIKRQPVFCPEKDCVPRLSSFEDNKSSPLLPPDLLKSLADFEEEEELAFTKPHDFYQALAGPLSTAPGRNIFLPNLSRLDRAPEVISQSSSLLPLSGFSAQENSYQNSSIFSEAYGKNMTPNPKPDIPLAHQEASLYSLFEGTPWSPSLPASSDHSTPASQSPHSSNPSSLPSSPPTHSHGSIPFSNFGPIGTSDSRDRRMTDRWKAEKTVGGFGLDYLPAVSSSENSWHQASAPSSTWAAQESPMEDSSTVLLDSLKSIWSSSMMHPGPSALEQLLMQQKQKQQRGHGTMNPPH
ncbi:nonsense-mediated mRNA decay factor SMG7 isoform X1 [Scleropages formosus]|uniref:Nonsense-mediated mRNA decay factor n=1 Tax=Scleropages formosus TaxID=113540 RepID=A0A8C9S3U1_SCLFO|nr:protein SMG7 isoform X1 [Scleropages formosus]XP_029106159.1 protein SMG7 isoform X1 [Scleropages formosus]XP_029106160.1 protein SMG7 isoform X1 [Scleropages formosus]